jgi:hypothetical protein
MKRAIGLRVTTLARRSKSVSKVENEGKHGK